MRRLISTLLLAAVCVAAPSLHAQQPARQGTVELRNVAEVEATETAPDGKKVAKRMPADKAPPGTEVIYTSSFRNTGKQAAGGIVVSNPIPANTTLVGGSGFGENATIAYSADHGKTWAPADQVKVRGADGKDRPAGLSEFTDVRWTYRGELAPGKSSSVGFRVTVN